MKKLFPILAVLVLISTACQLGGGQAQPTPIAVATAIPTSTPIPLNATGGGLRESDCRLHTQLG